MVEPSYKDGCILPGGAAHGDEPAHEACAREVTEETGLANFRPGRLLLVDYTPAQRKHSPFSTASGPRSSSARASR